MKLVRENINFERGQDPLDAMKLGKKYEYSDLNDYISKRTKSPDFAHSFWSIYMEQLLDWGCKTVFEKIEELINILKDKNMISQKEAKNLIGEPKNLLKDEDGYNLFEAFKEILYMLPLYAQIEFIKTEVDDYIETNGE
jgi:hypothetical protein